MPEYFAKGDVVTLRGGSCMMTVENQTIDPKHGQILTLVWLSSKGRFCRECVLACAVKAERKLQ